MNYIYTVCPSLSNQRIPQKSLKYEYFILPFIDNDTHLCSARLRKHLLCEINLNFILYSVRTLFLSDQRMDQMSLNINGFAGAARWLT